MLIKSGNLDESLYGGNSMLLEVCEENNKNRFVYVGANIIHSFVTTDQILENFFNIGDNIIPYSMDIGEKKIYFLSPHCENLKREKIRNDELLETNGKYIDLFIYHLEIHVPNHCENLLEFTCVHSS